MPFTLELEDLLPDAQQLRTVQRHELVTHAINIMHLHEYDQLPVIDADGKFTGKVVTFNSILQAVQSLRANPETMLVRDVAISTRSYPPDEDLLTMLDDIERDNFALIVNESGSLTGIVTTADTAIFFRKHAEDLLQIEGIETRIKDAIRALYAGDDASLKSAIEAVTDRVAEIRKKLPVAIKAYLGKGKIQIPTDGTHTEALAEAEKKLGLPEPDKCFEDLSFDEFTYVLLRHPNAPKLPQAKDVTELRVMLQQVRDARNKLAHFKGELTPEVRRTIKFAAEWLEANLPMPAAEPPPPPATIIAPPPGSPAPQDDEIPKGSYAPLAAHLKSQDASVTSVEMTFQQVERILGKALPSSAFEYRAWWANDPSKPQSTAWLDEGWRTVAINMSERLLTFIRSNDRANSYIEFFENLNTRLRGVSGFQLRDISPKGANWQPLAFLPWTGRAQSASIFASFTRSREMRIELYLDCGNKEQNKQRFDELLARKKEIETIVGEPLQWERRDDDRACRIAIYTRAHIQTDAQNPILLDWSAQKAVAFYKAFAPEFPKRKI